MKLVVWVKTKLMNFSLSKWINQLELVKRKYHIESMEKHVGVIKMKHQIQFMEQQFM